MNFKYIIKTSKYKGQNSDSGEPLPPVILVHGFWIRYFAAAAFTQVADVTKGIKVSTQKQIETNKQPKILNIFTANLSQAKERLAIYQGKRIESKVP